MSISMKKIAVLVLAVSLALGGGALWAASFSEAREIAVVSREDGSGTRGAFIELFGVEVRGSDGSRKDMTTKEAVIARQTDVMMATVAGDVHSIGYISLGSLNSTVKALKVDGAAPSAENVKNGSYPVVRPFNIAVKGEPSGLAKDFIAYILSKEGQAIAAKSYIPLDGDPKAYSGGKPSGKIVVAGSSSVSPLMEKLIESYRAINKNADIELQTNDSSAGLTAAVNGTCDIAMASRDLKDTELAQLTSIRIALDGLAVIVNSGNPADGLTKEQVRKIFTGETAKWSDVQR